MRRRAFAYRRRASPLHAARATAASAYCLSLAGAALLLEHPLVLAALLVAVVAAGAGAGLTREMTRTLRTAAVPLVVLTVAVNLLVNRQGLTVFARLGDLGPLGQLDLTVEALVYGLVFALRLIVVMLAAVVMVGAVDPDEQLRALRRVSHRSALTATLATRLVSVLGEDASRMAEAQRCRADAGRGGTRARLAVLRATVSGALDRSLDVAATLEVRGYGAGRRPPRSRRPWSRHDLAFALAAGAVLALAVGTRVLDLAPFRAYPLVHAPVGVSQIVLSVALVTLAMAPFADQHGIEP
jgi:energy-coupling factor transport system permease protein